jgi:predicted RNA binding protein YcfA (HicA-like mRNA interferase family)
MKLTDVVRALRKAGCHIDREGGRHTVWRCPCGQHITAVPRHRQVTAGVVGAIAEQLACLSKGWIQ